MIDSPTRYRVLAPLASFVFLLVAACSPSTTGRGEAERAAMVMLPRVNGRIDFGRLDAELASFTRGAKKTRVRRGVCPGCLVDIEAQAIGKSYNIDPLAGPGGFTVIGQFENKDQRDTEEMYTLLPGHTYLVFVQQAQLNQRGTSRTVWGTLDKDDPNADLLRRGYVEKCHPDGFANKTSDIDFYTCDPNARRHPDSNVTYKSSMFGGVSVTSLFDRVVHDSKPGLLYKAAETWFECDPGCCTGTQITS